MSYINSLISRFSGFISNPLMSIMNMVIYFAVMLISLIPHEVAHAYVAYKNGDDTAKLAGRISFNPLVHLDLAGTISLLLFGFGWAKPVPVNYVRLNNPRKDLVKISLAGPLTNLVIFIVSLIIHKICFLFGSVGYTFMSFLIQLAFTNLSLFIFNLLPIPPLDGYKVLRYSMPNSNNSIWYKLEAQGRNILIILTLFGVVSTVMGFFSNGIFNLINGLLDKLIFAIVDIFA